MKQGRTYKASAAAGGIWVSLALSACVASVPNTPVSSAGNVSYLGVNTQLLDGDLVTFDVSLKGTDDRNEISAYAQCAAAQYALIRGFGFARHVRTNVSHKNGIWQADSVYTISPSLPEGLRTIDAEVVVHNCRENRIPTV